ncbi:MAG: hypothetical protein AAFQ79_04535 [Pseudomonadota bacterium]
MENVVGVLMFSTFGFVLGFAYLSIRGLQKLKDSDAPKSSLSRDGIEERMATGPQASNV